MRTLSGRCAALVILPAFSRTSNDPIPEFGAGDVLALVAIPFIVLTVVHQLAVGRFAIISDEATYLTQLRWMAPGRLTDRPVQARPLTEAVRSARST